MLNYLSRTFFNLLYRFRRPAMVQYWKRGNGALARVKKSEQGHYEMQVQGEDQSMSGFPRGPVLFSSIGKLKHMIKTRVFNAVAGDLKALTDELKIDMIEPDKMVPAVKHIWDTFELMENMEVTEDMKGRIKLMKEVICFFLDSDDAYRFRTQHFLYLLNQKKVKLSKKDIYYARGKYWKPDMYWKLFGKVFNKYDY
jgi:hypothetical protein